MTITIHTHTRHMHAPHNKLNLIFTPLRLLLLDHITVHKHAKAFVHSYPDSHTGPSARKSFAINFGTLKIGDASVYYLRQGARRCSNVCFIHIVCKQTVSMQHYLFYQPSKNGLNVLSWEKT